MHIDFLCNEILRGQWLLLPEIAQAQHVVLHNIFSKIDSEKKLISDENPLKYKCIGFANGEDNSDLGLSELSKVSVINLSGIMMKSGTMCSYGTQDVADAIIESANDVSTSAIILCIDSGGGSVSSIPPLIQAIQYAQSLQKQVIASVDLCASAAYYTACYCDKIFANNDLSAVIGSIGVMTSFADYSNFYAEKGIKIHEVYSDFSTNKNIEYREALKADPNKSDDTHYNLLKSQLNSIAEKFQQDVTANRPQLDNDPQILSGAVYSASQAVINGMIDGIKPINDVIDYAMVSAQIKKFTTKNN